MSHRRRLLAASSGDRRQVRGVETVLTQITERRQARLTKAVLQLRRELELILITATGRRGRAGHIGLCHVEHGEREPVSILRPTPAPSAAQETIW